jgi:hypothetical protein
MRAMAIIRPRWILAIAAASLLLLPSAVAAQTGDPSIGTPQANQYEIPVQAGRHDAAPPKDQGGTGGGSLYRSNNNFGSSSVVPGDPGGGGGPAGGASAGGDSAGGGGGAGGGAAGVAAGAAGVAAAATSNNENPLDTGSPSTSAAYTTLPLIIILGIVIGIAGARMRRRAEV